MSDQPRRPLSQADARYGAARSRRLLLEAIAALDEFEAAITVVGAHAVHVWVQAAWGAIDMESTRDGDLAVNPVFVTPTPKLAELMQSIGTTPAMPERPGIYGYSDEAELPLAERTTVDLIVPEAYAGPGRRAARIAGQLAATSRAVGLELAVWDRHLVTLTTVDEPTVSLEAFVAGPAALVVAKAHKVHERFEQVAVRPDRLRPKDSGDVALLMMVSDGAQVAEVMVEQCAAHPEIRDAVASAAGYLVDLYADEGIPRQHMTDALAARFDDAEVLSAVDSWISVFRDTAASHGLSHPR
ncbi:hypothetical protein Xcel_2877 [Xylanimonas cellulosilytica DSM 15894]|uniref:Uncharacterized protein n=1 Tax=Xylanimonas cellulosilytica (strain DSM 15894 / JCM 12276 / CECT 5975 / KCTC 9989 / LMG 20990 / NBRC 107835 / XIL07) TaxID=446471 RepID=D1BYL8_XYLCX|nr:hypothetical protein [Xylanimonas cellulosilytica]ACZ31890.1 hypothetical protein Xcel_2877 [Xylanimonas cellulosilytica DSM 15894]